MRLRRLAIRTLPGIEPGFTLEPPSDGINLVVGPNASGKSSLVRALRYLLGADKRDPTALSLEAEFEDGACRWQVVRNGSQIAWRRDGATATRPALPGAEQIGLYRLSVESLLDHEDDRDRKLAARLRRELLGNCDLDALRAEAAPRTAARFGGSEARALAEKQHDLRQVRRDYTILQQQEAELPDLKRRIDTAAEAAEQRQHLARALKLVDAIAARKAREEALRPYPREMDRLRGDEAQRLDQQEQAATELRETLRTRQTEQDAASAEVARTGLQDAAPAEEALQAVHGKLRTLGDLAADRKNAHDAAVVAAADQQDKRAQLGGSGPPPRIDADTCRRAEALATALIATGKRLAELQELLKAAGRAPDGAHIDRLRDAANALRDWLAGFGSRRPAETSTPRSALWTAALGAFAAAVAAAWATALQAVLPALFAAAAAALSAIAAVRLRRRESAPAAPAGDVERRFAATGVDPPTPWDEQSVGARLRAVQDEWDALRVQQKQAEGAGRVRADFETARKELGRLEAEQRTLAEEIGFDPTLPATAFDRFVRLCSEWDQARARHAEQRARVADLDQQIAAIARETGKFLDAWPSRAGVGGRGDAGPANDADGDTAQTRPDLELLRSRLDHLDQRVTAANDARRVIEDRAREIESLRRDIKKVEEATRQVYTATGIEPGDRAALAERLDQWPGWKAARRALDETATAERLAREDLAGQAELIARADAGDRAQIQADHDAAAGRADEHTRRVEERQAIVTLLQEAGKDRRLEAAGAAAERARQALEDRRQEALLAEATGLLLDDVEQAFKAEHEPDILRRARAIFADVTARSFDLQLRADGTFVAHDVRQDAERELEALSSGTRMQLLLALRLAWTEAQEQGGETLPLLLDEALTTSDETRFRTLAQSLERIAAAEDGRQRQIFYLSARRHEAALWQQATGNQPAVIDLAAVRSMAAAAPPDAHRVATQPPVPAPNEDETAEAYADRLRVPRFDPRRHPGDVHLFHVLRDDLPLLHYLLTTWRATAVGPFEHLLANDAARSAIRDAAVPERLQVRCRVVREWTDQWRVGRGRTVDRGVLERCDAVSDKFIGRVADLAVRLGGDGSQLLAALRDGQLRHFQASKADALEQWLADEGYIDDREQLTADARRRLTLQRVAPATAADARDANDVIDWLESAATWLD